MERVINSIKLQPDIPVTLEQDRIDKKYKKLRKEILISIFFSYVVFYLTRKNFAAAMPAIFESTDLTATDFGVMSSMFYILYGAMKFVGGMMVDKINPRAMTGPALIAIGIINILFGFSESVTAFFIFFCLNAIVQGTSFPPMAKMMAEWFSKNERGRWWAVVEGAHNVGGALAPILTAFAITSTGDWRMGFFVPGAISLLMGLIALFTIHDRPRSKGLPTVGEWRQDESEIQHVKESKPDVSFKEMFFKHILKNPFVWLIIGGDTCVYIARTILNDWPTIYYTQMLGWDLVTANSIVSWFEVGGLVGGLLAGYLSDILFKNNRWMTGLMFAIALCVSLALVPMVQGLSYMYTAVLFGIIGFALYGPHMLFAVGCLDVTHKDASGSVTGFRGLFSYLGAALAGVPVVMIKSSFDWDGVFVYALGSIIVMTVCLAILSFTHKLK
ncbi:MFS transporter [Photobacterium lutimaris]|uniref:MFS transporter n=1 Tax=Photobacterium lutimaris TaxID=388278 RepID=A0A2T3IXC0_9GAMM|nr:MFS transporter [Photobacterium lutimaris]PSU33180.1 MFS transporter [Photobacterium lutimaris]TDR75243.1 OPA family sugar phosphate sensor protein UhpC-like MFS transporter [Photobacterium lutimaris]